MRECNTQVKWLPLPVVAAVVVVVAGIGAVAPLEAGVVFPVRAAGLWVRVRVWPEGEQRHLQTETMATMSHNQIP